MSKRMTILFILALLVTISTTYAQGITGGLKAGMNIANLHGDDVIGPYYESKMGFCAGGFITFKVANIVAIQPEVLYTQKGTKQEEEFMGETWKATFNLNYLEIPVLLKVIMPVQGMIKPHLFVGPYFAYNLTAKLKMEYNGSFDEIDFDEYVKNTDFGAVFGGGIDFGLPAGKIVFDARYSLGLTTIDEEGFEDVKNNVFSFMLGYAF